MKRLVSFIPAAVYYLLISIFSSTDIGISVNVRHLDKAAHFAEYALLGFLLALGFFHSLKTSLSLKLILSLLTALILAVLDELHQFFVPWRAVEFLDLLADATGSVVGVLVFLIFFRRKKEAQGLPTVGTS